MVIYQQKQGIVLVFSLSLMGRGMGGMFGLPTKKYSIINTIT
jgi:hypothetical protein